MQMFTKAMMLLFDGDKMEARIQRRYMEEGRYELCIDQGTHFVPINGQPDWSKVESGTQIVMLAILERKKMNDSQGYDCPRCKTRNSLEDKSGDPSKYLLIDWSASLCRLRV
jgi:hypothetical protein